jgi:hypothetical protein
MNETRIEKLIEKIKDDLHHESGLYDMMAGGKMYAIDLDRCKDKLAEKLAVRLTEQWEYIDKAVEMLDTRIDFLKNAPLQQFGITQKIGFLKEIKTTLTKRNKGGR